MGQEEVYAGPRLRRWMDRLAGALEIPPEITLDVPKATLIGTLQLQIENHRGVVEYSSRRVRVRTRHGDLVVSGNRLQIGNIFQHDMVIEGNITGVELTRDGNAT